MKNDEMNLDTLVLKELKKIGCRRIIPFPLVYYRLGAIFHFDRETSQAILRCMERKGWIEVKNFHGVRILRR
ncbi:MAG: hypothetical protein ACPLY9_04560 [Nitrososphaerales archaeon]